MQIDKKITYRVSDYSFTNFITLDEYLIKQVWQWRNAPEIRAYMYNKEIIPLENHLRFVQSLLDRDDVAYWLVKKGEEPIGVTNLTSVDLQQSKAELGYYMIPEMQKKGIGIDFAFNNFVFAFCAVGIETLFGGIDKRNINAITLDSYLGCKLSQEDLENLESIEYIRWKVNQKDFIAEMDGKNDFRRFVRYTRENKELFDKLKQYA